MAGSTGDLVHLEADWERWLRELFPHYATFAFADHHRIFWEWVWSIRQGVRSCPFIAVWARGGAKSTSAELACVALAARHARKYALYVSSTQDQADDHVGNVASMLESTVLEHYYPDVGERQLSKYGNVKGWRRSRLRTSSGFILDALGLDTAARGKKVEEQRPDLIILDDIDEELDTPLAIERKISTISKKLLPAGAADLTVLGIQNLVHENGVFAQLVDGRADFLGDRYVSGPIPALLEMSYDRLPDGRYLLIGGIPTWDGQDLARCQQMIDNDGMRAFRSECLHEVGEDLGGIFSDVVFKHVEPEKVPPLLRIIVAVDPAVTNTDESDSHGIQVDGIDALDRIYCLRSWEGRTSPVDSLERAILWAVELGAEAIIVETDQGGDTWLSTYREAWQNLIDKGVLPATAQRPRFRPEKAGSGHGPKVHRAEQMLADYERGHIYHVTNNYCALLEKALRRFPKRKPYDLVDANYWAWQALRKPKPSIRWLQRTG